MVVRPASALQFLSLLVLSLSLSTPAPAQTVTGTMQGTARDTSDAVLPGVTITIPAARAMS
jgi:hypothetical protein